jgi:hypothetical protein
MKFGLSQISKQSPLIISRLKRVVNFLTFTILAYSPKLCEWYGWSEEGIMTAIGLFGIGVNVIGIMFGVEEKKEE